jgi:tRNA-dihydrouridine synthase 1
MLHARLFKETAKFRDEHFQPKRSSLTSKERDEQRAWLDGNHERDRPLFVQFCANKPEELLEAAEYVAPYCDAVDLNLGCPQGIARSGHYGAFLQEDWDTIHSMISRLHRDLSIPVTAKMRILETREKTLEYARMILSAGASILTVHGRRREQKGHNMGTADLSVIRYLRDNLPPETVLFANGNILNSSDIEACLAATGADGVMSAEGNLSDPTIFARPLPDSENREYYRGPNGSGGYRVDGVLRRYMDIIHRYVLDQEPPSRPPLYLPGDPKQSISQPTQLPSGSASASSKKRKRDRAAVSSPNLRVMQGHIFQLLRPMINIHTHIRDALAQSRAGDIPAFENVLSMVEEAVAKGLDGEVASASEQSSSADSTEVTSNGKVADGEDMEVELTPSQRTIAEYKRPWWVCQPHIRPLPDEALKKGAITISKKQQKQVQMEHKYQQEKGIEIPVPKEEMVCR